MIIINSPIIFFALKKLNARNVHYNSCCILHILAMCHLSEITLNQSLHRSNCNRLLRRLIHNDCLWSTSIHISFFCQEIKCKALITRVIVFYISYQYASMSEITLNVSFHGSNCNRLLIHLLLLMIIMNHFLYILRNVKKMI